MGRAGASQGLSPCVWTAVLSVSSQGRPSVRVCVLIPSSYKDPGHTGSGPTLVTSCYLSHLCKGSVSKYSRICRFWGSGLPQISFRGTQFSQ